MNTRKYKIKRKRTHKRNRRYIRGGLWSFAELKDKFRNTFLVNKNTEKCPPDTPLFKRLFYGCNASSNAISTINSSDSNNSIFSSATNKSLPTSSSSPRFDSTNNLFEMMDYKKPTTDLSPPMDNLSPPMTKPTFPPISNLSPPMGKPTPSMDNLSSSMGNSNSYMVKPTPSMSNLSSSMGNSSPAIDDLNSFMAKPSPIPNKNSPNPSLNDGLKAISGGNRSGGNRSRCKKLKRKRRKYTKHFKKIFYSF